MRVRSIVILLAAAVAVGLVALELGRTRHRAVSTASRAPASATRARLTIANYAFAPARLTVKAGSTITVTNTDSTPHTVTARSEAFDSGTLKPGRSGHFTLKRPGTYTYFCQFHAFMTGTIKVAG